MAGFVGKDKGSRPAPLKMRSTTTTRRTRPADLAIPAATPRRYNPGWRASVLEWCVARPVSSVLRCYAVTPAFRVRRERGSGGRDSALTRSVAARATVGRHANPPGGSGVTAGGLLAAGDQDRQPCLSGLRGWLLPLRRAPNGPGSRTLLGSDGGPASRDLRGWRGALPVARPVGDHSRLFRGSALRDHSNGRRHGLQGQRTARAGLAGGGPLHVRSVRIDLEPHL